MTIFRKLDNQRFPEGAVISIECELSRHNVDVKWMKVGDFSIYSLLATFVILTKDHRKKHPENTVIKSFFFKVISQNQLLISAECSK